MFSIEVRIGSDLFKLDSVPVAQFPAVLVALEQWYRERSRTCAPIHGTLVFEAPVEQPS